MKNKFKWIDDSEFDRVWLFAPFYIYAVYCRGCEVMTFLTENGQFAQGHTPNKSLSVFNYWLTEN